jgi:hypothetical protein
MMYRSVFNACVCAQTGIATAKSKATTRENLNIFQRKNKANFRLSNQTACRSGAGCRVIGGRMLVIEGRSLLEIFCWCLAADNDQLTGIE